MPDGASHSLPEDPDRSLSTTSPKLRLKLHRFWGGASGGTATSATKPTRPVTTQNLIEDTSMVASNGVSATSSDIEERQRRRSFAHYDCQSMTANLG